MLLLFWVQTAERFLCVLVLIFTYHCIFSRLPFHRILSPFRGTQWMLRAFLQGRLLLPNPEREPREGEMETVCWHIWVSSQARKNLGPRDFWAGLYSKWPHPRSLVLNSWKVLRVVLQKFTLSPGCEFEHNCDQWVFHQLQILNMPLANQREISDFPQKMFFFLKHTVNYTLNIIFFFFKFLINLNLLLLSGLCL